MLFSEVDDRELLTDSKETYNPSSVWHSKVQQVAQASFASPKHYPSTLVPWGFAVNYGHLVAQW